MIRLDGVRSTADINNVVEEPPSPEPRPHP